MQPFVIPIRSASKKTLGDFSRLITSQADDEHDEADRNQRGGAHATAEGAGRHGGRGVGGHEGVSIRSAAPHFKRHPLTQR